MMRKGLIGTLMVAAIGLSGCASTGGTSSPFDTTGSLQVARLEAQAPVDLNYLVYLPANYDNQTSWPVVLFLHGGGERGDDIDDVKVHGPPMLIEAGQDFPFIMIAPQSPVDRWWQPTELSVLLDMIEQTYNVDADRIYVTGLSLGGIGTWRQGNYEPDRFAALAPICGGGEIYWAAALKDLPIWAFHGAKDKVISVARSQAMVDAIRDQGGQAKLTIYPDADHDSWTQTYDDPAFWDWLLAQSRAGRPTGP